MAGTKRRAQLILRRTGIVLTTAWLTAQLLSAVGQPVTTRRNEIAREWMHALEHILRKVVTHTGFRMAQCPAHDDGNPWLSIKVATDGGESIAFYAGCDFVDILKAVGFYRNAPSGAQEANADVVPPKGARYATSAPKHRQNSRDVAELANGHSIFLHVSERRKRICGGAA